MPRALQAFQTKFQKLQSAVLCTALLLIFTSSASAQYQVTTSPVGMIPIRGNGTATTIHTTGDDTTIDVALPFDFRYFNQSITAGSLISVNTNGVIAMDPTVYDTGFGTHTNTDIPTNDTRNGLVCLFWDDLLVQSGTGLVSSDIIGTAPNRIFVIEYSNLSSFNNNGGDYSGQVLFFEGSNIIDFRYDTTLVFQNSPSATIGLEDTTGMLAVGGPNTLSTNNTPPTTNFRFDPGTVIGIDLNAANSTPSLSIANGSAGDMVDVTRMFNNNGSMASGMHTVTYYLSTDAVIDSGDTVIGTEMIADTLAFASDMGTQMVTIPGNTPAGAFFIGFIVDSAAAVMEVDEMNNASVGTPFFVNAGPTDVTAVSVSTTQTMITPGAQLVVTREINNPSANAIAPFRVGIYLSDDNLITTMDTLIDDFTFTGGLAGNTPNSATVSVTVPGTVATTGNFFIGVIVDFPNDVVETDENNNVAVSATTVASMPPPDVDLSANLVEVIFGAPNTYAQGAIIDMDRVVFNSGTVDSGAFTNEIFLSSDSILDSSDTLIFSENVPSVLTSTSLSGAVQAPVPAAFTPGSYFLIMSSDSGGIQPETDETNNVVASVSPITVTGVTAPNNSDLQPTQFTLSAASGVVGDTIMITTSVTNNGTSTVSLSDLTVFLSDDATIDTSDTAINSQSLVSLVGGGVNGPTTINFEIPQGTIPGTYFFGVFADSLGSEPETDESNNILVSAAFVVDVSTGDLNGDGRVSVADVQVTVNQVLQLAPQSAAADFNGDSFFDILDVQSAVNLAMGRTP